MAGVSLRGTVEKREKESVYLKLDIDGADGKALHPYPWIPPTGNVMYCMPQEGTEAYLYFPEAEEESAYAVSEIHNSRCPVFADAQRRELVTEHGKKLRLHADMLGFAGGKEETVQECRMREDGIHFGAGRGKLQVTGREQILFHAPEISLDAVQKIGQYKMESMAKEKAGMLYPRGGGNPATGGDGYGVGELQNEYNALSSQGILAGTEYEYYKPFDDAPEYEEYKEVPTWLKVVAGVAVAAVVGLAVGALVVATGGLAAAALGVTAVQLGMTAGVLTAGAGIAAVAATAASDKKNGTESSLGDYIRNVFSASARVGASCIAITLGMYGAEVMTLTVSGGMGLIPVGGTVVTLSQLAGAFQLVAGIVTSQNLLFQIEEVLMFCTSGKEMGAPTGNGMHDSVRELTEMASTQFAFYGLMNPYTYHRPKITPLPNETGLTVPGGTGVAVVPNGTAPALKQPYLPGQYTEYPAAVQGLAQQALPGGGSGIEDGLDTSIKNIDEFIGGNKSFDDVLDDYAKVYADKINSNQAWSWDDTIPGGENLTKKQRSIIKQQAIDTGLITDIKVTKVEGMRYGFADFESAGVVKETQYLPENMWKMSDAEQFKWLDEQIGGTVDGYTWHHTEIPGKMQLVPTGIHNITTHNGGRTAGMWADAPR